MLRMGDLVELTKISVSTQGTEPVSFTYSICENMREWNGKRENEVASNERV